MTNLEQRLRTGVHGAMPQDLAVLAKDTHVQAASMQINAAIRFGLLGVESHEVSSSSLGCLPNASSPTAVCRGGGLNKYQHTAADGGTAARCGSVAEPEVAGGAAPAAERGRSGGHAAHVRPNAALTSFAAWFGNALRAAEPGCFTCHGGHQAFGLPSPAPVSAAFGG
jgi:hypothetical protein